MTNFYLDNADRETCEPLLRTGLFRGLTTNPTILAASGIPNAGIAEVVGWATEAGAETVFVQSWGRTASELVDRGLWIRSLGGHVVVKIPATEVGLEATARLAADGHPVLVTAVYAATQVLPAMAAGARFIAPYLGRMNDTGRDGFDEIKAMQRAIAAGGSELRILVASLRSPGEALRLAELGVSEFTLAPAVWRQFFEDPLTTAAVEAFDAASLQGGEV